MKYLLDVNAMLAAILPAHADRIRFVAWAKTLRPADFATCALTQLGFIRVAVAAYGYSVADARTMLLRNQDDGVGYVDSLPRPAEWMPDWVQEHSQTTDGYLCAVAASHGLKLATFDTGIKDATAELIP